MSDAILSKNMLALVTALSGRDVHTEDIFAAIRRYVPAVAEEIGMSCVEYSARIPEITLQEQANLDLVLYDNNGSRDVVLTEVFEPNTGGSVTFIGYAPSEAEQDETLQDNFYAMCSIIFSMCGRINSFDLLDKLTFTDSLTGTYNQSGFAREVTKKLAKGRIADYCSIFLNIKNFKYINQKVGTKNGDRILCEVVNKFRTRFGSEGLISRLGADNFMILILKDDVDSLLSMLKDFVVRVYGDDSDAQIKVYFKAGIYYADENSRVSEIMECASAAYATAKSGKKGDFIRFEPQMQCEEAKTKQVLLTFPEAIRNREFKVFYQPKVRSSDNKLVGAEALCRWIKDDGSIVPPMDFIPVLERFGGISNLDLYMLGQVCRDMREWLDNGITPVRTSVNLSRRDLVITDLAGRIRDIVDKYRIPHDLIEIELTETFSNDEFSKMIQLIRDLRSQSFKISIDDFGAGYSTLTLLKDIPADIIKLDRSFIKDMTDSSMEDRIILRNVVHMVKELSIEVIAEGIETKDQVTFLGGIGCSIIQGYYYDKPLPKEEFDARLSDECWYRKPEASPVRG